MTDSDTVGSNSALSMVVGDTTRTQLLEYLCQCDSPQRQVSIADELDISEASVSRAKQTLIEAGVIESVDGGLRTVDGVGRALKYFEIALQ